MAFGSSMFRQGLWLLLLLSVLLLPVQPLERSSPAAGDTGTWDALPEPLEEQDTAALRDAMVVLEALPWICTAVTLLLKGLSCAGPRAQEALGQLGRDREPPRPWGRRVWGSG